MNIPLIISFIVFLVVIITIHEFSHAWMGHILGDVTAKREGRLTLNPLAHIDPFLTLILPVGLILLGSPVVFGAAKPVPFNPYAVKYGKFGAALVAFAGPASNFLMALFVGLIIRFSYSMLPAGALNILTAFVSVNLAFFVFNMIPIPPLDGSRLLYAVVPPAIADAMDRFERYGIIVLFLVLIVTFPIILPFISKIVVFLEKLILGV